MRELENGNCRFSFASRACAEFCLRESNRVRSEVKATLDELLRSNQLTDEEGYYFIEQLDNVPVQLISTRYHDEGDAGKGGIEAVRDGLYRILSASQRFEQSRNVLKDRLEMVLGRLRRSYSERLNTANYVLRSRIRTNLARDFGIVEIIENASLRTARISLNNVTRIQDKKRL